jgi:hypothetical protein
MPRTRPQIKQRVGAALLALSLVLAGLLPAASAQAQSASWQVFYYPNSGWQGNPAYFQNAGSIAFNWGSDTPPGPNMPAQNWTARMVSTVFFYAGIYRFQLQADDEFALYIDNVLYADTRGANQPGKSLVIDVPLTQGNHYIDIEYRQFTGPAYLFVSWDYAKGNGGQPQPPPPPPSTPNQLFPPPPSLVTDYGDYTSCAQQQIHQKNCFRSNGAWDAPNMGSIEMEPQILRWTRCTQDQVASVQLYQNQPAQTAKCSKTQAGWFPA